MTTTHVALSCDFPILGTLLSGLASIDGPLAAEAARAISVLDASRVFPAAQRELAALRAENKRLHDAFANAKALHSSLHILLSEAK